MRFLFVDRILELSPGKLVRGIKHVTREDYYLCQDDERKQYFVPSFIGETLGQLAAWCVMVSNEFTLRPVAGIVSSAQLLRRVYVGDTIYLESFIESLDDSAVRYHSVASVNGEEVFRIENALGPLLPISDFIDESDVRFQLAEIYRPGAFHPASPLKADLSNEVGCTVDPNVQFHYDRILDFIPGKSMIAQKLVNRAASYFPDHFPRKPVLPMTVLLECKLNLANFFLKKSKLETAYQIREMRKIKMNDFVYPGDILTSYLKVKHISPHELIFNYRSEVDGKRVCVLEIVMTAKDVV